MLIIGMFVCGMVFVIIVGEIDLLVGLLFGLFGGVVVIFDVNCYWLVVVMVLVVFVFGVLIGFFNGWWLIYWCVLLFIVGLGGMFVFCGILFGVIGGLMIVLVFDGFVFIG